ASDPSEPETLGDLARIRRSQERFADVASLLERQIDVELDPARRLSLRQQLADLYGGPLEDRARAIEALVGILDEDPTHLDAMDSLEKLYSAEERWSDVQGILDRRLEIAETDAERIAARVRLARLNEQAFGQRAEAMSQLREILELDATNDEALDELERLLGLDERWDELVTLLEERLARASDDDAAIAGLEKIATIERERRSDSAAALAAYERILSRAPGRAETLLAVISLHEASGDDERTAEALERYLEQLEGEEAI